MTLAQFHLTFPPALAREPTVFSLGTDFDVQVTIRRANVDEQAAWFILDVDGEPKEIERAVAWLVERGVVVDRIAIDG
jgi:L-aspartate semialdehyde sulfurtransferase ferredoxin